MGSVMRLRRSSAAMFQSRPAEIIPERFLGTSARQSVHRPARFVPTWIARMSTRHSATSSRTSSADQRPSSNVRRFPRGSVTRCPDKTVTPPASPPMGAAPHLCQVMAAENKNDNLLSVMTKSCNCYINFSCYLLYLFDSSLLLLVILSFK